MPSVRVRKSVPTVRLVEVISTMLLSAVPVLLMVIRLKVFVAPVPLTVWFEVPLKTTLVTSPFTALNDPLLIKLLPMLRVWVFAPMGLLSVIVPPLLMVTVPETVMVLLVKLAVFMFRVPLTVKLRIVTGLVLRVTV